MHLAILAPSSESLAFVVKQNAEEAPQHNQTHVRHNWRNIPRFDDPRSNEFREAISPNILVDGDGHKDAATNRFVRIDTYFHQLSFYPSDGIVSLLTYA